VSTEFFPKSFCVQSLNNATISLGPYGCNDCWAFLLGGVYVRNVGCNKTDQTGASTVLLSITCEIIAATTLIETQWEDGV